MPTLDPVKNFAKTRVSSGQTSAVTTNIRVVSGGRFPAPSADGAFNVVWFNKTDYPDPSDDPNREIVRVLSANSTGFSKIIRAQEGTTAKAHNTAGKEYYMILAPTKKLRDDINTTLDAKEAAANKSTDTSLGTSNTLYPSQNAVKAYVDNLFAGFSPKTSCKAATTANLNATYVNGASGVGATLTNAGALAAFSVDGVSPSAGDRILVKNQTTQAQNGIYTVTTVGSGAVAWVLTRATDYDSDAEINESDYTVIDEGTSNAKTLWVMTTSGAITVGTTSLVWSELLVAPQDHGALTGLADDDHTQYLLASGSRALTGALNEAKGTDIASAATTDIGAATGNYVVVTGTTTITGLGTVQAGTRRIVKFAGILTLTHNATSLILPTGANITTAADDTATFVSLGSGNWVCVSYQRKDGTALAATASGAWTDLGSTTLGVAAASMSVSAFTAKKFLEVYIYVAGNGGTGEFPQIQFNSDTGANYAYGAEQNGGGATSAVSQTAITFFGANGTYGYWLRASIINVSDKIKLLEATGSSGGASGTAPWYRYMSGLWDNTAAQITTITIKLSGGSNLVAGSYIHVIGMD